MYNSEDDLDKLLDKLKNSQSEDNSDRDGEDLSPEDSSLNPESIKNRKNQLERLFIKLIAIGLSMGLVLGIGVYIALEKLGLSKKPYDIKREQQQPSSTEQIDYKIKPDNNQKLSSILNFKL